MSNQNGHVLYVESDTVLNQKYPTGLIHEIITLMHLTPDQVVRKLELLAQIKKAGNELEEACEGQHPTDIQPGHPAYDFKLEMRFLLGVYEGIRGPLTQYITRIGTFPIQRGALIERNKIPKDAQLISDS